jgi:predicted ferric reductase
MMTAATQRPVSRAGAATPAGTGLPLPARGRGAHPGATLAAITAGAIAVIALWWHDTTELSGLGDWLTNAGRVAGLLAGYSVVVLVALMARIPLLERGIGADNLARWHAKGGRYTVSLIVAHALLIVWGYAVSAHTDLVSQTKTLLLTYPDVLMATVGGLLLVGVGIVSARAARRRMRYETWYYLHLYTYLAIALAFSHQFSTGADLAHNRAARAAWVLLYLGVVAAVVWYRFAVPLRTTLRHRLRVEAVYRESGSVVSVVLAGRHLDRLRPEAGQFFRWRFLTRGLWWASNPYSLSAPAHPNRLRITAKTFGAHSAALTGLRPGTRVLAEGPYGAMTAARRTRPKVLLIAGGIGITPLRALFETLPGRPGDLRLVYRTSRAEDIVFREELHSIARARSAHLHFVVGSRRDLGYDPLSTAALARNVPDLADHDVYVCGPDPMTATAIGSLRAAGVPRRRIHRESFDF